VADREGRAVEASAELTPEECRQVAAELEYAARNVEAACEDS
jgi:hypothetical protein